MIIKMTVSSLTEGLHGTIWTDKVVFLWHFSGAVFFAEIYSLVIYPFQRSGNAVLGIPYALASLSYCQSFNLDLLKASATLVLAELWLSLGPNHAKKALALLHSCFPMLLGHGGLEIRSRAFIVEAKCYLANPDFSGTLILVCFLYSLPPSELSVYCTSKMEW